MLVDARLSLGSELPGECQRAYAQARASLDAQRGVDGEMSERKKRNRKRVNSQRCRPPPRTSLRTHLEAMPSQPEFSGEWGRERANEAAHVRRMHPPLPLGNDEARRPPPPLSTPEKRGARVPPSVMEKGTREVRRKLRGHARTRRRLGSAFSLFCTCGVCLAPRIHHAPPHPWPARPVPSPLLFHRRPAARGRRLLISESREGCEGKGRGRVQRRKRAASLPPLPFKR